MSGEEPSNNSPTDNLQGSNRGKDTQKTKTPSPRRGGTGIATTTTAALVGGGKLASSSPSPTLRPLESTAAAIPLSQYGAATATTTFGVSSFSPPRRTTPSSTSPYHSLGGGGGGGDDSFAYERCISTTTTSWEEGPSFDDSEEHSQLHHHPQHQYRASKLLSSGSSAAAGAGAGAGSATGRPLDGRVKPFDTTTPTLIDEEDDSEMLQLQRSFDELGGKDDTTTINTTTTSNMRRRTPGASSSSVYYYNNKSSTYDPSQDDDIIESHLRQQQRNAGSSTPVFAASTSSLTYPDIGTISGVGDNDKQQQPLGDSSFGVSEKKQHQAQRRMDWNDEYESSSSPLNSSPEKTDTTLPPLESSSSPTSRQPRGLFSFEPWARTKSPESATPGGGIGGGGARLNSGAFSPNILRLTEDIGNLLQEDEDDEYTLDIPGAFRGSGELSSTATTTTGPKFDWTGSYVYDVDHHKKPAVPTRSAIGAEKLSRRRPVEGRNLAAQSSHQHSGGSSFLTNAQQPKPRRNEVFEFGIGNQRSTPSDERQSPQLLIFGGAFAPPVAGVNATGFMRPVASFHSADPTSERPLNVAGVSPFTSTAFSPGNGPPGFPLSEPQRFGNFQVGASVSLGPGIGETLSYDSYRPSHHDSPQVGRPFIQHNVYQSLSPTYGLTAPMSVYASQQSEMQATARVFVPQTTQRATPTYHGQTSHQPWPPSAQQLNAPVEEASWQSNASYNYGSSNIPYGMPVQAQQAFIDPRACMTPSPHLPMWQQQQGMSMDMSGSFQSASHHHIHGDSALSPVFVNAPSPHPSMAGSEHSNTTTQRAGKKETKRKQRGKKKPQKAEPPTGSLKKTLQVQRKKGESLRIGSPSQSVEGMDDPHASASDDLIDAKRSELMESPATRIAFKEFYRAFRGEERTSFQKAEEFARNALNDDSFPDTVHWRVFLELADLAKRSNRYAEARCLYQKVCHLQPYASQGWLEYSKLEEECGRMNRVMNILHQGLNYCEYSENLLTRALKHQEKMGNLDKARGLLARLKHVGVEKVWRTVLEGALLEARAGNINTARRVLKYLMHHVPWYGPLYLEAYRLEKDQGNYVDALHVVEKGLQAIPRYGPLWFGAFRLCEEMDMSQKLFELPSTMLMIERAAVNISKELVWKVHLEASQMLERAALEQTAISDLAFDVLIGPSRYRLAMTILTSPNNLRWKVWLAAARMELGFGNTARARSLFLKAHEVVPRKGRSSTLMECARLEDFVGDTKLSRAILQKGRLLFGHDWKVWLESVLLEIRDGNFHKAMEVCETALISHQGTGRLWATLVHLRQYFGRDEAQHIVLRRALNAVPKSGEVWCEGGRIHLNPFANSFDLDRARRHLYFATRFTPQYGDGFVETIRLELVKQWLVPIASYVWETTKHAFRSGTGGSSDDGLTKYVTDVSLAISIASRSPPKQPQNLPKLVHHEIIATVRTMLDTGDQRASIDLNDVRLACVNADPNYGLLWFHCRQKATDSPRRIIEDTAGIIAEEIRTYAHLYLAAMIRREAILSTIDIEKDPALLIDTVESDDPVVVKWEEYVDRKLYAAPSLEDMINPKDPTTGILLLENTANGPLFATGLTKINRHLSIGTMSLSDRRRALFGNDALFP